MDSVESRARFLAAVLSQGLIQDQLHLVAAVLLHSPGLYPLFLVVAALLPPPDPYPQLLVAVARGADQHSNEVATAVEGKVETEAHNAHHVVDRLLYFRPRVPDHLLVREEGHHQAPEAVLPLQELGDYAIDHHHEADHPLDHAHEAAQQYVQQELRSLR